MDANDKDMKVELPRKLQLKKTDVRALKIRAGLRTGLDTGGDSNPTRSNDCTNPQTVRTRLC